MKIVYILTHGDYAGIWSAAVWATQEAAQEYVENEVRSAGITVPIVWDPMNGDSELCYTYPGSDEFWAIEKTEVQS